MPAEETVLLKVTPELPEYSTLVVKRDDMPNSTLATTPAGMADVVLKALSPIKIILIRTARAFLQALLGTVGAANLSTLAGIQGLDFRQAVILAAATASVTFLQNAVELLAKLDQTIPELRG